VLDGFLKLTWADIQLSFFELNKNQPRKIPWLAGDSGEISVKQQVLKSSTRRFR